MSDPTIVVHNVVSYTEIDMKDHEMLNLKTVAAKVEGSRYNPKRFPAVIIRKSKPKGTGLVFKSGKIIIIGAQAENDSEILARKVIKDLSHVFGKTFLMKSFRITNIVASAKFKHPVDIGRIAEDQVGVKDDNFPGLVYRVGTPIKSALIFSSGKVMLTGALSREACEEAYFKLHRALAKYFIKTEEPKD